MYDSSGDNMLMDMYDRHITLTNNEPSIIIQELGVSLTDESHKTPVITDKTDFIHVGMCVQAILKYYLSNSSAIQHTRCV